MNKKTLLIPLVGLLITGCALPNPSTSTDPSTTPTTSETSTPSEVGTSEQPGAKTEINGTELNNLFGFDIYATLPKIMSSDYSIGDFSSEDYPKDIYIDLFDWVETDAVAYDEALAAAFEVDEAKGYIITEEIFGFVTLDEESYDQPVYTINLYSIAATTDPGEPTPKAEINGATLNAFFDTDIYSLLPKIYSDDYAIDDFGEGDYPIDVYVDCFDWTEADALAYDNALAAMLPVDEENGYIIADNLYVFVMLDDQTYDTPTYSINIYSMLIVE